jgi:hypothetical protein
MGDPTATRSALRLSMRNNANDAGVGIIHVLTLAGFDWSGSAGYTATR